MEEKLSIKNYVGYTICDAANNLAFCVMGTYLATYCTDILGITGTVVTAIFWIARIWDAINDPIMGSFVQRKKPGKGGKYRPFILWAGFPLAVSAVIVFIRPSLNVTVNIIYVAATYILYGMLYTVLSVPYGSLAMVMTSKENERSNLSVCRAIGGGFGNAPQLLFPILVMTGGDDGQQMDGQRLFLAMCVVAVVMMLTYILSYRWTKETALVELSNASPKITSTLKDILKDRAFVTMSLIGSLIIAMQMYISSANVYLFKDFYKQSSLSSVYLIISYLPMGLLMPFANKLIRRFGKKEICVVGFSISTVAALISWLGHFTNPMVYIILALFVNTGIGFAILEIWALCADIVDHQEWITGKREEATNYAVFTFMRKMGQAVAAIVPILITAIGYDTLNVGNQTTEVTNGIYTVSTLVPFLMIVFMLVLILLYPLNRKKTEQMYAELKERRAEKLAQNAE